MNTENLQYAKPFPILTPMYVMVPRRSRRGSFTSDVTDYDRL